MNELFLHYIWQYQQFDKSGLLTTNNEPISIFHTGSHNQDSGPDFGQARLKIGDMEWVGSVEIHLKSSDWIHHGHGGDPNYDNVILHVVWQHDQEIKNEQNQLIPTLELMGLVSTDLIRKHDQLIRNPATIPCESLHHKTDSFTAFNMVTKTALERLNKKSDLVLQGLKNQGNDWEAVAFHFLARAYGIRINQEPFEILARSIPINLLKKCSNNQKQVHSLLFGMAGLLDDPVDEFQTELKTEFNFLRQKHNLLPKLSRFHWKFSRLRPPSFPTVRLAQLGTLIAKHPMLYRLVTEETSLKKLQAQIMSELPEYWLQHYDFGKRLKSGSNSMGKQFSQGLIINGVAPILVAASRYFDNPEYITRVENWLSELPAETNKITKTYNNMNLKASNSLDSQGLIQLYQDYCMRKRCMACNIGVSILKSP